MASQTARLASAIRYCESTGGCPTVVDSSAKQAQIITAFGWVVHCDTCAFAGTHATASVAPISAAAVRFDVFMEISCYAPGSLSDAKSVAYDSLVAAGMAAGCSIRNRPSRILRIAIKFSHGATKTMDTGSTPFVYEFGEFQLDAVRRVLRSRSDARPVDLPPRAFDTLLYLVEHAGDLVEKQMLMDAVWSNVVVEEGNLTQTIYLLRRALGEQPDEHQFIVTVPKRGYKFVGHVRNVDVLAPGRVEAAAAPITMPPPAVDNARRRFARRAGAWTVVLVLLLGGGAFWYQQRASEAVKDAAQ